MKTNNLFLTGYYRGFLHSRKIYSDISFADFYEKANQLSDAYFINIVQTNDDFSPRWDNIRDYSHSREKYTYKLIDAEILFSSEDFEHPQNMKQTKKRIYAIPSINS